MVNNLATSLKYGCILSFIYPVMARKPAFLCPHSIALDETIHTNAVYSTERCSLEKTNSTADGWSFT